MPIDRKRGFALLFLACLGVAACGSSATVSGADDDTDTSLSDPTVAVVADIGSTHQVLTTDMIDYARFIADNLGTYVADNLSGSDDEDGVFLAKPGSPAVRDDTPEDFTTDVEITEAAQDCTDGGTKQLVGTLSLTVNSGSDQGAMTGTYNVLYSDCVEMVRLETATASCVVETHIDGAMQNDVTITFQDLEDFDIDQYLVVDSVSSDGSISFSVGEGATNTMSYAYDLQINSTITDPSQDGSLTFGAQIFDVNEITDFVSAANADDVCGE